MPGDGLVQAVTRKSSARTGSARRMVVNDTLRRMTKSDSALLDAVDIARQAAEQDAGADLVGEYIGAVLEDERVALHTFECRNPAYQGWQWAVVLTRAPRAKQVTVNEVVLLPGPGALTPPPWVPWSERVQPGDLGVGDVLPTEADDVRLVPGYTAWEEGFADEALVPTGWEIGLGRVRVLSVVGRDAAAERWSTSDFGPDAPMAQSATEACATCGFLLTIGGPFGQAFGVCGNAMSPADGHVVALNFGCGAHSEVEVIEPRVDAVSDDALGHS
jgi:hypothetical protein